MRGRRFLLQYLAVGLAISLVGGCSFFDEGGVTASVSPTVDRWICPGLRLSDVRPIVGESPKANPKPVDEYSYFDCNVNATDSNFAEASVYIDWGPIEFLGLSTLSGYPFAGKRSLFGQDGVPFTIDGVARGEGGRTHDEGPGVTAAWRCGDEKNRGIVVRLHLSETQAKYRDPAVDAVNLIKAVRPWACGEQPVPNYTPTVTPSPGY